MFTRCCRYEKANEEAKKVIGLDPEASMNRVLDNR
jgi:hypothetical protein